MHKPRCCQSFGGIIKKTALVEVGHDDPTLNGYGCCLSTLTGLPTELPASQPPSTTMQMLLTNSKGWQDHGKSSLHLRRMLLGHKA